MGQTKAGRNDPCPCGSGTKYKKCCLSKDEEAWLAHQADKQPPWPPFTEPSEDLLPFEELYQQPAPDPIDLYDSFLLFRGDLLAKGEHLLVYKWLERIRHERPEAFSAQAGWYCWSYVEAALILDRIENLEEWLLPLFTDPAAYIDMFFQVADVCLYFGQTGPLLKAVRAGWPRVQEDRQILPHSIHPYASLCAELVIIEYLAEAAPRPYNEVELLAALRPYVTDEHEDLRWMLAGLPGTSGRKWRPSDFGVPTPFSDQDSNLRLLTVDFAQELHTLHGFSLSKARMARTELELYLGSRLDRAFGKQQKHKWSPLVSPVWLVPDCESLAHFLGSLMDLFSMRSYRAAAFWEAIPRFLTFLGTYELIDDASYHSAAVHLRELQPRVLKTVAASRSDPRMRQAIETCWDQITSDSLAPPQ